MEDEELRIRYNKLLNDLYIIKSQIEGLFDSYDNFISCMKDNLLIDDKILEEGQVLNYKKNMKNVYNELLMDIIPYVKK